MVRSRLASRPRQGFVLLVVISMLILFALLGIAFVVYAQSEADIARAAREAESVRRPDMDPEMLHAYILSQVIYDTNDTTSALRSHSLARNMYGTPGSTVAFNGTGRFVAGPNYRKMNYTDGRNPEADGSGNPPYTYPDLNNFYLAAVRADGTVLIPSYYRKVPGGVVSLRPTNVNAQFPAPDANGLDVKNIADGLGYNNSPNDACWMDAGLPVMRGADGETYKALVAVTNVDLDNRINVNVHGFNFVDIGGNVAGSTLYVSSQGWGLWETNPVQVFGQPNVGEVANLIRGANGVAGRYDPGFWNGAAVNPIYVPQCTFNSPVNYDCYIATDPNGIFLPGGPTTKGQAFISFDGTFAGGSTDSQSNPRMFNYFDPLAPCYYRAGTPSSSLDRIFPASSMEALLRYNDTGSPALTSQLFALCPTTFSSNPRVRRLVTTHSYDVIRPGVVPYWTSNAAGQYTQPAPGGNVAPAPSAAAVAFSSAAPPMGEFNATWQSLSAAVARVDVNRPLTDYPAVNGNGMFDPANVPQAQQAITDRQNLANDLFNAFRQATGAATPASVAPGSTDYDALRYLAQLAVNIVDFVDTDDYSTPFNWNPAQSTNVNNGWVFGNELPRLVINEAYGEVNNDPKETATATQPATKPYKVNFWVELHNPVNGNGNNAADGSGFGWHQLSDNNGGATTGGVARLYNATGKYAGYQLVVAKTDTNTPPDLLKNDNVLGDPDYPSTGTKTLLVVSNYTPEPSPPNPLKPTVLTGDSLNQVLPYTVPVAQWSGTQGGNTPYYVIGPNIPFPGTGSQANLFATLPVQDTGGPNDGPNHNAMSYTLGTVGMAPTGAAVNLPKNTILLRKLACPYLPPQLTPGQPNYNPYITIDYMDQVPTFDGVVNDGVGKHTTPMGQQKASTGRNQPYAAAVSQQILQAQNPAPTTTGTPQNTFFQINSFQNNQPNNPAGPTNPAYGWLFFADRNAVSSMELLNVSGFKPHMLTQQFVTGAGQYQHRAPWFDEDLAAPAATSHRLYRCFDYIEGGHRFQRCPIGGRMPGKININTIWDPETFNAMGDYQGVNLFTQAGVTGVYNRMTASRTPGGTPGPNDAPFWGYSTGLAPAGGDPQYPNQNGINLTLFRPANAASPAGQRILEPNAGVAGGEYRADKNGADPSGVPYFRFELMNKIANTITTRSNVFAVYTTVGFFQVDSAGNLGAEIGASQGRAIRHRSFTIVDRSALTVGVQQAAGPPQPITGTPGQPPYFLESLSAVSTPNAAATINVPVVSGNYDGLPWQITPGSWLVVDSGQNQEVVQVTGVGANTFTATFKNTHPNGFAISNTLPGHPGPQQRFDPRNPGYQLVVRYFSIIR